MDKSNVCIKVKVMVKLLCFYPQVVAHQGTNPAQYCLTSVSDENWCFQCGMVLDITICSGKRTSSQYQK